MSAGKGVLALGIASAIGYFAFRKKQGGVGSAAAGPPSIPESECVVEANSPQITDALGQMETNSLSGSWISSVDGDWDTLKDLDARAFEKLERNTHFTASEARLFFARFKECSSSSADENPVLNYSEFLTLMKTEACLLADLIFHVLGSHTVAFPHFLDGMSNFRESATFDEKLNFLFSLLVVEDKISFPAVSLRSLLKSLVNHHPEKHLTPPMKKSDIDRVLADADLDRDVDLTKSHLRELCQHHYELFHKLTTFPALEDIEALTGSSNLFASFMDVGQSQID